MGLTVRTGGTGAAQAVSGLARSNTARLPARSGRPDAAPPRPRDPTSERRTRTQSRPAAPGHGGRVRPCAPVPPMMER